MLWLNRQGPFDPTSRLSSAEAREAGLIAQVYREGQGGYWRASKAWCRGLQPADIDAALRSFVDSGAASRAEDVYGGASGALVQLRRLAAWFEVLVVAQCADRAGPPRLESKCRKLAQAKARLGMARCAQVQRHFLFYSMSALFIYEGAPASAEGARATVRLIDFAHTFAAKGRQDTNCLQGILALTHALAGVVTKAD